MPAENGLPLSGICVVECGHSLAGPYAGMILAGLGAEVIKIEPAGRGDYARDWGPPFVDGASALFHAVNHGKSSIALTLSDPVDTSLLRRLILDRADVVLQNMKAGGMARYRLDGPALLADKPSLVYCNLGAFGEVGPLRDKPGYDPMMQAVGGLMSFLGSPGEKPSRIPVAINDMGTGLWAAVGVLAALTRRQATGKGEVVSVSLYETAVAWSTVQIAEHMAAGILPRRWGSGVGQIVPHQAFECADVPIMVAAGNDRLFSKLCEVLGHPALAADPRYVTNGGRVTNRDGLIGALSTIFSTRDAAHWLAALDAADIPCGRIQTIAEVVQHEQTQALNLLGRTSDNRMTVVGLPISFGGRRPDTIGATPALGADGHLLDPYREERT